MVTVLGTSLQNKDLLKFFHESTGCNWFRDGSSYYQKLFSQPLKSEKSVPHDVR
jgi:hypothetical protein